MDNLLAGDDLSQTTMMVIGILDSLLSLFILILLLITCRCLLKTRRSSPTLITLSFAFAVIVFIGLFCDMGYNFILLTFATYPEKIFARAEIFLLDEMFTFSTILTALKIYQRFALILLNAFVSINRAFAVFMPLLYPVYFNTTNTIAAVVIVFQLCSPIFVLYAFQLYDCLYFFDPHSYSWFYRDNTCRDILIKAEYVALGFVHSSSILIDIFVTIRLYKQVMQHRTSTDLMDFSFMVQTLILAFSGAFITLYLHTFGTYNYGMPWLDHIPKFNDLLLALIYTASIAFYNKRVRRDVMHVLCFCKKKEKDIRMESNIFSTELNIEGAPRRINYFNNLANLYLAILLSLNFVILSVLFAQRRLSETETVRHVSCRQNGRKLFNNEQSPNSDLSSNF